MDEWVTLGQARDILVAAGVAGARRSEEILWAGLVPRQLRGRREAYLRRAVLELCARPVVTTEAELPAEVAKGVLVVRMRARRVVEEPDRGWIGVDADADVEEQEEAFRKWWRPPPGKWELVAHELQHRLALPFVVTVGGVVVAVRNITAFERGPGDRGAFVVEPPKSWAATFCAWNGEGPAEPFQGYRFPTGRGTPLTWWPATPGAGGQT